MQSRQTAAAASAGARLLGEIEEGSLDEVCTMSRLSMANASSRAALF